MLPSRENFVESLAKVKYETVNLDIQKRNTICPLSLDAFEKDNVVNMLPCLHVFTSNLLHTWLLRKNTCPLCRTKVFQSAWSDDHNDDDDDNDDHNDDDNDDDDDDDDHNDDDHNDEDDDQQGNVLYYENDVNVEDGEIVEHIFITSTSQPIYPYHAHILPLSIQTQYQTQYQTQTHPSQRQRFMYNFVQSLNR